MISRIHLVEMLDCEWFPTYLRNLLTDFLSFLWSLKLPQIGFDTSAIEGIADLVEEASSNSSTQQIVDLCSGSGGPPVSLYEILNERARKRMTGCDGGQTAQLGDLQTFQRVVLTDLYPNVKAFKQLAHHYAHVSFVEDPVDALTCRFPRPSFRTLFNGFHHFKPREAEQILRSAVDNGDGIGVFELTSRKLLPIMLTMFGLPLLTLLLTPWVRPTCFGRYVFTYLIPIVPLCQSFNGTVSCLRTYTEEELLRMAREADPEQTYEWKYQSCFVGFLRVTSFVGYSRKTD